MYFVCVQNCRKHFEEGCHEILSGYISVAESCSIHQAEGDGPEGGGRLVGQGSYLTEGEMLELFLLISLNGKWPRVLERVW